MMFIAAIQDDSRLESVHVMVFNLYLGPGPAKTKIFRAHPNIFNGAVKIAHNMDYNSNPANPG